MQTDERHNGRHYPRFKRSKRERPAFRLQGRDVEIVRAVHDYRLLNSEHIQALIDGSSQGIMRRLQKLFHHGYVDRPPSQFTFVFGSNKFIYTLGNQGADLLSERFGIDRGTADWTTRNREAKQAHLSHELMLANFHACLTLALGMERPDVQLLSWRQPVAPDAVTFEERGKKVRIPVVPDAYFGLQDPLGRMYQMVEADRSTMTNPRFLCKLEGYWHYWQQSRHTERYGIKNFRVLTICKTERRKENLRRVAAKASPNGRGSVMFWFTSEERYSIKAPAATVSAIWQTAVDQEWHSLLE